MGGSLRTVADRRIRDAQASGLDVRGPVSTRLTATASATKGSGLTKRERKVKAILLQELNKISGDTKTWAAHLERKRLADGLDVAYIDRTIAKMEHQLRPRPVLFGSMALLGVAYISLQSTGLIFRPLSWSALFQALFAALTVASVAWSQVHARKATQRRLWIYQALRELSDADDEGVQLDESVRLADLLIDRIIDQEEGAAPAPLHRIRTH